MFGQSCIVDMEHCDSLMFNRDNLESFIINLLEAVGMEIYDNHLYLLEYGADEVYGWTGLVALDMSSLTFHTHKDRIYIDLFSCKGYELVDVINTAKAHFGGRIVQTRLQIR